MLVACDYGEIHFSAPSHHLGSSSFPINRERAPYGIHATWVFNIIAVGNKVVIIGGYSYITPFLFEAERTEGLTDAKLKLKTSL